jgi:hypothetical protein
MIINNRATTYSTLEMLVVSQSLGLDHAAEDKSQTSAISNDQHHLSTPLLLHFNYSYPVVPPSINESSSTNHKDVETSHFRTKFS